MQSLAAGNDLALNDLMDDWSGRVTALLYRMTGHATVAGDLAQETFVRLYQARSRFHPGNSQRPFSTWLFGIAANLARNHLRWRGRHPEAPLEEAIEPSGGEDPSTSAEQQEQSEAVQRAVTNLPADQREVLILSEYEEMSHLEIASALGCSPKAVERRLSRARESLRKELSRYLL